MNRNYPKFSPSIYYVGVWIFIWHNEIFFKPTNYWLNQLNRFSNLNSSQLEDMVYFGKNEQFVLEKAAEPAGFGYRTEAILIH